MKESRTDKGLIMIVLGFCILNLSLGVYANYRIFRINKENNEKNKVVEKIDNKKIDDNQENINNEE